MQRTSGYARWAGIHAGETCVAIANGPGLANIPPGFLQKYPTFACNRFHLFHERTGFAPTYYVSLALDHYDTPERRAHATPMLESVRGAFINRLLVHHFPFDNVESILSGTYYGYSPERRVHWSYEPLDIIGIGPSMIYGIMQIAFYMGFTTMLLVGLDHEYNQQTDRKHFYTDGEAPLWEVAPGPLRTPKQWQAETDHCFKLAKHAWETAGRRIVNLSKPTACKVFERGRLREW